MISSIALLFGCTDKSLEAIVQCEVIEIGPSDHAWSGPIFKKYQIVKAKVIHDEFYNCEEIIDIYFELLNDRDIFIYDDNSIELF